MTLNQKPEHRTAADALSIFRSRPTADDSSRRVEPTLSQRLNEGEKFALSFSGQGYPWLETLTTCVAAGVDGRVRELVAQAEQRLVDRYGKALHATVFKAGHHGSSTSSTDALLQVVQPQAAAISCGLNNDYGHPHARALQRLTAAGADIYRTDTMGTITFTYQNDTLTAAATDTLDAAA